MIKRIKVCYSIRNNFGNALNPILIEHVLGKKVVWADEYTCETSGIGSGLRLFFRDEFKIDWQKKEKSNPCQIWSAGFLTTPKNGIIPIREFRFASVRGELSKAFLEKLYQKSLDITTGDAGLLASELINTNIPQKRYKVGIIPHDRERLEKHFHDLHNNTHNSVLIDVQDDPINVIKTMSTCDCIVSSSLHGLVVSDSLGIPNRWIKLTDKLLGDSFKFHDYYSSFGIGMQPLDVNNVMCIDCDQVYSDYQIRKDVVARKKEEIILAFNRFL